MVHGLSERSIILIAEHNCDDSLLLQRALSRSGIPGQTHIVKSGQNAIAYLLGTGDYKNRDRYPSPTILLLDIHMPKGNGFDVLEFLNTLSPEARPRVIVLTSSSSPADLQRAFELGADEQVEKSATYEKLLSIL